MSSYEGGKLTSMLVIGEIYIGLLTDEDGHGWYRVKAVNLIDADVSARTLLKIYYPTFNSVCNDTEFPRMLSVLSSTTGLP